MKIERGTEKELGIELVLKLDSDVYVNLELVFDFELELK